MDDECVRLLNTRYIPGFKPKEGYITLTTHNAQADEINESQLRSLKSKSLYFKAEIKDVFPQHLYPTKEELELKIGAQVMFVKMTRVPKRHTITEKSGN